MQKQCASGALPIMPHRYNAISFAVKQQTIVQTMQSASVCNRCRITTSSQQALMSFGQPTMQSQSVNHFRYRQKKCSSFASNETQKDCGGRNAPAFFLHTLLQMRNIVYHSLDFTVVANSHQTGGCLPQRSDPIHPQ